MHQPLASLLFPQYRRRVLELLMLRPEESLHGREGARGTGLPAGKITRELTSILRKTSGLGDVLSASTWPPRGATAPARGWRRSHSVVARSLKAEAGDSGELTKVPFWD